MERYVRILLNGKPQYALAEEDNFLLLEGNSPETFMVTQDRVAKSDASVLSPCEPKKIICSGLNYIDTVLEDGAVFPKKPLLFLKPGSAVIGDGMDIVRTSMVKFLTIEAELTVVIGKKGKHIAKAEAMEYVWGYLAANDVTAKDLQKEDDQWTRAKSFDTFLPLSSEIVSGINPLELTVSSYINEKQVQMGTVSHLLFDIPTLISYASDIMTLEPGDLILTGTPAGYGKAVLDGDKVMVEIPGVGSITNHIRYVDTSQ